MACRLAITASAKTASVGRARGLASRPDRLWREEISAAPRAPSRRCFWNSGKPPKPSRVTKRRADGAEMPARAANSATVSRPCKRVVTQQKMRGALLARREMLRSSVRMCSRAGSRMAFPFARLWIDLASAPSRCHPLRQPSLTLLKGVSKISDQEGLGRNVSGVQSLSRRRRAREAHGVPDKREPPATSRTLPERRARRPDRERRRPVADRAHLRARVEPYAGPHLRDLGLRREPNSKATSPGIRVRFGVARGLSRLLDAPLVSRDGVAPRARSQPRSSAPDSISRP